MVIGGSSGRAADGASAGPNKLVSLEAGRGIAALMVVVFHAQQQSISRIYEGAETWAGYAMGAAGVEFFFVLSGFIMLYAHKLKFSAPQGLGRFAWSRFARIMPLYWLIFLPLLALYLLTGKGPEHAADPLVNLGQFALLPVGDHMTLTVAWTLSHEMLFYLLFATLFVSRAFGMLLLSAWFLVCGLFFALGLHAGPFELVFSHYNLLFLFGLLAALLHMRIPSPLRAPLVLAAGLAFVGIGLSDALDVWDWNRETLTVSFGLAASVLVASLAGCTGCSHRTPKVLIFLGAASYSIYLLHYPVMNITATLLGSTNIAAFLPASGAFWGLVLLGTVAGIFLHLAIERPMQGWFRNLGVRRSVVRRPRLGRRSLSARG